MVLQIRVIPNAHNAVARLLLLKRAKIWIMIENFQQVRRTYRCVAYYPNVSESVSEPVSQRGDTPHYNWHPIPYLTVWQTKPSPLMARRSELVTICPPSPPPPTHWSTDCRQPLSPSRPCWWSLWTGPRSSRAGRGGSSQSDSSSDSCRMTGRPRGLVWVQLVFLTIKHNIKNHFTYP